METKHYLYALFLELHTYHILPVVIVQQSVFFFYELLLLLKRRIYSMQVNINNIILALSALAFKKNPHIALFTAVYLI